MAQPKPDLADFLITEIEKFSSKTKLTNIGQVHQISDGVAIIEGLSEVAFGELLEFPKQTFGLALNLRKDNIGVIVLGDYTHIKSGDTVISTGRILDIAVSEKLLGRVINPLGQPLDGKPAITSEKRMLLDRIAPGIIKRAAVNQPVQTGIKAIDAMIPIGRGQRELIIGDRGTGKSSIAITTLLNQKKDDLICIYVAIGQKESFVAQLVSIFEKHDIMENIIVVDASASISTALQYLAPLAGCAIGEYFAENGKDALVIYDDLTKHAWAYREISLLLRRPTGREAYPGDIFYLHSSLLERACKYNEKFGGGSLTALPIIETQAGDVSAYIPTNVISITDGQIYLETDLFNAGQKPAINAGASVSRVGSSAQIKAVKQVAGQLRMNLAQYRELAAFAQFASDLDEATRKQIDRGKRAMELLKQDWETPYPVEKQVVSFWAYSQGYFDKISLNQVKEYENKLLDYIANHDSIIYKTILEEKKLDEKLEAKIKQVVEEFTQQFLTKIDIKE